MKRSEIEHISVIPGEYTLFQTTCSCGDPNHSLRISVDKQIHECCDNKYIGIDIEFYFQVQWNDHHPWEDELYHLSNDPSILEKILSNIKYRLSWLPKIWNRIKTAYIILSKGHFQESESFLFRSGNQAEEVYRAIGDSIESFRNGDREIDELCDKYKNIIKSKLIGS